MSADLKEILPASWTEENHQVFNEPPPLECLGVFLAAFQTESRDYKIWPVRLLTKYQCCHLTNISDRLIAGSFALLFKNTYTIIMRVDSGVELF